MKVLSAILLFLLLNTFSHAASPLFLESSEHQTVFIELFTSEGCSSCPPADRWMSQLKDEPGLWRNFVPLQFHVDDWDHLGWKDKFGLKRHSIRQRTYASQWGARSVYTPGFVVNGSEWKNWGGAPPELSDKKVGRLRVKRVAEEEYLIEFNPLDPSVKSWNAHVAVLGMDLSSHVEAGENRGKLLEHDFVVLGVRTGKMEQRSARFTIIMKSGWDTTMRPTRCALAVWITKSGDSTPVQAAGGFLSPN